MEGIFASVVDSQVLKFLCFWMQTLVWISQQWREASLSEVLIHSVVMIVTMVMITITIILPCYTVLLPTIRLSVP